MAPILELKEIKQETSLVKRTRAETDSDSEEETHHTFKKKFDKTFSLPGGYIERILPLNPPDQTTRLIRRYYDIVYGVCCQLTNEYSNITNLLPYLVQSILQYNNIEFETIKYVKSKIGCYEPLSFTYNIDRSELILYLDLDLCTKFCAQNKIVPVNYSCGLIPIEQYNPYKSAVNFEANKNAFSKAIIVADHTAQHIINEIYHKLNNQKIPDNESMHYNFCKYGTTAFYVSSNAFCEATRIKSDA